MTIKWMGEGSHLMQYGALVAEIKVTSPTTSVNFTGLDANKHGGYVLVADMINGTGTASDYYLFFNGDTASSGYSDQFMAALGATLSGASGTNNRFVWCPANGYSSTIVNISLLTNGLAFYQATNFRSDVTLQLFSGKKNATISNITSLTITAQTANAIGTNSLFRLYRRK